MKSSILLRADLKDEARYDSLVRDIHNLLLNDALVIDKDLFREEGPFTDPKISSYILAYFGPNHTFVDYSSHQRTDERFEMGDIWIRVIGTRPRSTANCICQQLGHWFERAEKNIMETAFNYARMRDRLKLIYTPEEMEEILDKLEDGRVKAEDLPSFPVRIFGFLKKELVTNLKDLLIEDTLKKVLE
jgi:hypothetical protein